MTKTFLSLVVLSLVVAGCSDDPVSSSAPVGLNDKIKSGDVKTGTASFKKSITSESGNPWAVFVKEARDAIGADPADIRLDSAELLLGTGSTGVTQLGEVFRGTVDLQIELNDSKNIYPLGSVMVDSATARSAAFDVSFDFGQLSDADKTRLLAGSFDVVVAGPAAAGFESAAADAEFQLTLVFSAFE